MAGSLKLRTLCTWGWVALICASGAQAQTSAVRRAGEDWKVAAKRSGTRAVPGSALSVSRPVASLDRSLEFRAVRDKRTLLAMFAQTRDWRFLPDPDVAGARRRLSWMYPDDGCFMRAEYVTRLLNQQAHRPWVNKLFVFGNLEVDTANAPRGKVNWWFHVVAATGFAGHIVVFDPAIDPSSPLLMETWLSRVTKDPASLSVSLCRSGTYLPNDACDSVELRLTGPELSSTAQSYLHAERARLLELGRDPVRELADSPPWTR
jgi:hypothetical protein